MTSRAWIKRKIFACNDEWGIRGKMSASQLCLVLTKQQNENLETKGGGRDCSKTPTVKGMGEGQNKIEKRDQSS